MAMEPYFAEDSMVHALDLFPVARVYYKLRRQGADWETVAREVFVAMRRSGEMPKPVKATPGTLISFGRHSGKSVYTVAK